MLGCLSKFKSSTKKPKARNKITTGCFFLCLMCDLAVDLHCHMKCSFFSIICVAHYHRNYTVSKRVVKEMLYLFSFSFARYKFSFFSSFGKNVRSFWSVMHQTFLLAAVSRFESPILLMIAVINKSQFLYLPFIYRLINNRYMDWRRINSSLRNMLSSCESVLVENETS